MNATSTRARSRILPCSSVMMRASGSTCSRIFAAIVLQRLAALELPAGAPSSSAPMRRQPTPAHIGGGAVRNGADGCPLAGIDAADTVTAGGRHKAAVDEVIVAVHENRPDPVCNRMAPNGSCPERGRRPCSSPNWRRVWTCTITSELKPFIGSGLAGMTSTNARCAAGVHRHGVTGIARRN